MKADFLLVMTASALHIPAKKEEETSPFSGFGSSGFSTAEPDEGKLALDIYETDDELVFIAPMAGVEIQQIQVLLTEDVLTISGERHFPKEIFTAEPSAFLEECYWGKFSRSIVLPAAVNSENISAKLRNGILIITVPKAKKAKSKKVPIEVV